MTTTVRVPGESVSALECISVDMAWCIFRHLRLLDVVALSRVSRTMRSLATHDRLWERRLDGVPYAMGYFWGNHEPPSRVWAPAPADRRPGWAHAAFVHHMRADPFQRGCARVCLRDVREHFAPSFARLVRRSGCVGRSPRLRTLRKAPHARWTEQGRCFEARVVCDDVAITLTNTSTTFDESDPIPSSSALVVDACDAHRSWPILRDMVDEIPSHELPRVVLLVVQRGSCTVCGRVARHHPPTHEFDLPKHSEPFKAVYVHRMHYFPHMEDPFTLLDAQPDEDEEEDQGGADCRADEGVGRQRWERVLSKHAHRYGAHVTCDASPSSAWSGDARAHAAVTVHTDRCVDRPWACELDDGDDDDDDVQLSLMSPVVTADAMMMEAREAADGGDDAVHVEQSWGLAAQRAGIGLMLLVPERVADGDALMAHVTRYVARDVPIASAVGSRWEKQHVITATAVMEEEEGYVDYTIDAGIRAASRRTWSVRHVAHLVVIFLGLWLVFPLQGVLVAVMALPMAAWRLSLRLWPPRFQSRAWWPIRACLVFLCLPLVATSLTMTLITLPLAVIIMPFLGVRYAAGRPMDANVWCYVFGLGACGGVGGAVRLMADVLAFRDCRT